MSEELTSEDRALLAALAALQPETGAAASPASPASPAALPPAAHPAEEPGQPAPPGDGAEAETLTRLYHEVLGLMPFALAPAAPSPEVKRRLMARLAEPELAGQESAAAKAPGSTQATPAPSAAPSPMAAASAAPEAPAPAAAPAPATAAGRQDRFAPASRSRSASVPVRSGAPRWLSALAAALILALLGTCGWLLKDMRERRDAVVRLAAQRDAALRHAGEVEARLGRLTSQVSSMRDSFSVMTSPAVEVCNLRAATPEQADARGMMFVAADHQHWAMSLRGLRPPAGGKVYQLWFVADQGPVSGGTFAARPGAPVELGSDRMPAGTKAVRITLESSPGSPAPSGPDVLRNMDTLHTL
ncbi:MAG TPA: anti-sigma factor [Thermoanaerobaculia bacterium]|nr:anti-sigma factor [Thermoanaerobaculia bacterium]